MDPLPSMTARGQNSSVSTRVIQLWIARVSAAIARNQQMPQDSGIHHPPTGELLEKHVSEAYCWREDYSWVVHGEMCK